ncbi:MAG: hypothetical protein VZQ62_00520 [Methanosphaera sp.]|nr:hypothetical protein [Methanosphaera sp.]
MNGYNSQNTKQELEEIIRNYQNTGREHVYELKKFNDNDEAENIFIMQNTIFIGTTKMQIKRLDGTIEKYNIEKYFPVDERDEEIKMLHKKVEELERRLNNEHTEYNEPVTGGNEPNINVDGDA